MVFKVSPFKCDKNKRRFETKMRLIMAAYDKKKEIQIIRSVVSNA